jgi:hypothetical protein
MVASLLEIVCFAQVRTCISVCALICLWC